MKSHDVELSDAEYSSLNASFPQGTGSALVGERAEEIAKIHLARQFPHCRFLAPDGGADLKVDFGDDSAPMLIAVSGTASTALAMERIKASGQPARRVGVESTIPVFRVCSVFGRVPTVHMLIPGRDFGRDQDTGRGFRKPAKPGAATLKPQGAAAPRAAPAQPRMPRRPGVPGAMPHSEPEQVVAASRGLGIKPRRLRDHLANHPLALVSIPFVDFATIVGAQLPVSALRDRAFWENPASTSPWAAAWKEAGFVVDTYRLARDGGWVRFRKKD